MTRPPRLVIPGQVLHVIQRGNNRAATFAVSEDYERYTTALLGASKAAGCAIHAYVLMTNHVHLLMTPAHEDGPAAMMQTLGRRYVRYFNARHGRSGTLWEGRFRSSLVDSDRYYFACSRYIELNPVRAGIVERPGDYRWSSFRHNALGERDSLVSEHERYGALGSSSTDRRASYRALFDDAMCEEDVDAIRVAASNGAVLGGTEFRERVEGILGRRFSPFRHGGDRKSDTFVGLDGRHV